MLSLGGAWRAAPSVVADEILLTEDRLKSLWIYNLAKFIDRPEKAWPPGGQAFVIGVIGRPSLTQALIETTTQEKIKDHPIQIRECQAAQDISACHLVFVGASPATDWAAVAATAQERSILTVSDAPEFASKGGMITLKVIAKQIRCVISMETLRAASLVPRAKLLNLKQVEQLQEH
ncbi:MAG: YfiR family protein [Verrucomicrobiota bacterium]